MAEAHSVRALLMDDLRHMVEAPDQAGIRWRLEVITKAFLVPRIRAVIYYRMGHALASKRLVPLAMLLESRAIRASGAEISPGAQFGPGLCLMHSVGIVVGPDVRVGRNLRIYQGVTLGDGSKPGQPTIGDDVLIGAGASVLGGIRIGDRVIIGAGSVVTQDIPDDSVATGSPASWKSSSDHHAQYRR
jgi:serine O-acetyltransferase